MNIAEIIAADRKAKAAAQERTVLDVIAPDPCCSKTFVKDLRSGALKSAESWTCPKCCVEYRPTLVDDAIRHWTAHVYLELIR